jgi:hypothetical protein
VGVIDADSAHRREVDDEAVVDDGGARDVVAAAADGERKPVLGSEADRDRHVGGVGASRDHRRVLVDHAVPDAARRLVRGVVRCDDLAGELVGERGDGDGAVLGGRLDGHGWLLLRGGVGTSTLPPSRKATVTPA